MNHARLPHSLRVLVGWLVLLATPCLPPIGAQDPGKPADPPSGNRPAGAAIGSAVGALIGAAAGTLVPNTATVPTAREGGPHKRFLQLNERVAAAAGEVDLVFLGDSITQGWEGRGKAVWEEFYGSRRALNLGIGGDRTQHLLWRIANGNLEGISPKLVVVMIGTNNSGDDRNTATEMVEGITGVVNALRAKLPETRILLLGIFPRGEQFNAQRGKILQVNQVIRKLADGERVHFLDIGHAFLRPDGSISKRIMPDFLHLSERGYRIWANRIERRVSEILGEADPAAGADPTGAPPAPPAEPVSGTWRWTIEGPEGRPVEADLELRLADGVISGEFRMDGGRVLAIDEGGAFDAGSRILAFTVRRERPQGGEMIYRMSGRIDADTIEGSVTTELGGETITRPWSARRK